MNEWMRRRAKNIASTLSSDEIDSVYTEKVEEIESLREQAGLSKSDVSSLVDSPPRWWSNAIRSRSHKITLLQYHTLYRYLDLLADSDSDSPPDEDSVIEVAKTRSVSDISYLLNTVSDSELGHKDIEVVVGKEKGWYETAMEDASQSIDSVSLRDFLHVKLFVETYQNIKSELVE